MFSSDDMESEVRTQAAWQPLTPKGVAAFARASLRRLLLAQFIFALLATTALIWFVTGHWFPVIRQAVKTLPSQGMVRHGQLTWEGDSPCKLAENHFLALAIDLKHEGLARSPAHLQVEFGEKDWVVLGLLGAAQGPYPKGYQIVCSRDELDPWWGAWSPMFVGILAIGFPIYLLLSWAMLSLLYSPAAWLVALFANRDLRWREACRLCGAALMPGALLMTLLIFLYGVGALDPIKVLVGIGADLVLGWIYVLAAPFFLPRSADATPVTNPFGSVPENLPKPAGPVNPEPPPPGPGASPST